MKYASILSDKAMHYVAFAVLLAASLLPALIPQRVDAGQLTSRSVQLDSSAASVSTIHGVAFTTTQTASSVEVLYCAENPIEGDTCTTPAGLDASSATATNVSGITTPSTTAAAGNVCIDGSVSSGAVSFDLDSVTNPSASDTTFYVRLSTWSASGCSGSTSDFGGIAVSTSDQVTVTAKVHETLTFTVTTLTGSDNSITLGDANGVLNATNTVYDSTGDNAELTLATNAQSGVDIRLSGDTLIDDDTSEDINAAGSLKAFTGNSSTEEFGLHVDASGSTNIAADADYDGSGGNYALVNTGGAQDDITQAGGAVIATTSGPTDTDTAEVEFAAQASNTTPAGVYDQTFTFIATGTF